MMWDDWKTNGIGDWLAQNDKSQKGKYTFTPNTIPWPTPPQKEPYTWQDSVTTTELDIDAIINKAMEKVQIRDGDRTIELDYATVNALLLLIETLMEMGEDNELARVFKTKLAMQKLSGEDCGTKS